MAWDEQTGAALAKTAQFSRQLAQLKPGERINLCMRDFQDMEFPVPPWQRMTWQEKAEWLRSRAPFHCRVWGRIEDDTYVFERPKGR